MKHHQQICNWVASSSAFAWTEREILALRTVGETGSIRETAAVLGLTETRTRQVLSQISRSIQWRTNQLKTKVDESVDPDRHPIDYAALPHSVRKFLVALWHPPKYWEEAYYIGTALRTRRGVGEKTITEFAQLVKENLGDDWNIFIL